MRTFARFIFLTVTEYQIYGTQHKTADDTHDDRITDALLRFAAFTLSETDAHKRTAAVTNHNSYRKGCYSQRKDNSIGGVSVGAEICCIGVMPYSVFRCTVLVPNMIALSKI